MHVVIMGSGRTGSLLAAMLDEAQQEVTIIDWDSEAFDRLPESFSGRTIVGNAVDQDVLRQAGIETAEVFVAATSGDNRNIMAGQVAKQVFSVPRVILRIKDPNRAAIYTKMGLQVDCRTSEGVNALMALVEQAVEV